MKLLAFFAVIAIGALLFSIFDPAVTNVGNIGTDLSTTDSLNRTQEFTNTAVWTNILTYLLAMGTIGLIAAAIFRSRVR